MILGLRIENGVKYKDKTFTFQKGLTTISGPNGAGKSLIQEFIRFGLFGSQALRGKISDYDPKLKVTLCIRIRDENIIIKRTLKDCEIEFPGGCSRGTTLCNSWIVHKLGYNMSVFDIGNAAKQFEINKLGDMKPSERKSAVDQVIGLSVVTKLIKELKEERNNIKNYVSGFESALIEPKEPIKPENYRNSQELKDEYNRKIVVKDEMTFLERKCEELKCDKVENWEGNVPSGDLSKEILYNHYLEEYKKLPENAKEGSNYTEEYLEKWVFESNQWLKWKAPEITLEKIEEERAKWREYKYWSSIKTITCPKCGAEFVPNHDEYKKVEQPKLSEEYLREQEQRFLSKPTCEKPTLFIDRDFVKSELEKIEKKKQYDFYSEEIKKLSTIDFESLKRYEKWQNSYKKWKEYESYAEKLKEIKSNNSGDLAKECETIWNSYTEAKIYEDSLSKYNQDKREYDRNLLIVSEKKVRIVDLEEGIDGLTKLISRVKNYIIPSLSSVATKLCQEMSNDELSEIKINDEFEILVDGKELSLLSGSEKAVANLAIRLALSSILTRKVFNVFMGDEIDESMSEERANSTAECLKRLKDQIDQIILISHRNIVGDNVIDIT